MCDNKSIYVMDTDIHINYIPLSLYEKMSLYEVYDFLNYLEEFGFLNF